MLCTLPKSIPKSQKLVVRTNIDGYILRIYDCLVWPHLPTGVSGEHPLPHGQPSSFIPDDVHVGPNRVSRGWEVHVLFSWLRSIPQLRRQVNGFYIVEWALINDFAQVSGWVGEWVGGWVSE